MFSTNTLKAIVRSLTPWATSVLAAVIAHFGWHASPTLAGEIVVIAGAGLTIVLHAAETKFPWVGALLGWVGAPAYAPSLKKLQAVTIAKLQAEIDALTPKSAPVQTPQVADSVPPPTS